MSGAKTLSRLRSLLIVAQIAISLVLMICGWLFVQSLNSSKRIPLGFRTADLLLASLNVGSQGYNQARAEEFYSDLTRRIIAIPGVNSASTAEFIPLGFSKGVMSVIDGTTVESEERELDRVGVYYNAVGPNYFKTVETPITSGRDFNSGDNEDSQKVAIVSEAMAKRFWPNQVPIGKRFKGDKSFFTVVGVAGDIRYDWIYGPPRPMFYVPLGQNYSPAITFFIRADAEPLAIENGVLRTVADLDSGVPVYDVQTLAEHIEYGPALLPARMGALLTTTFGLLGLVLAAVGVYGVVSHLIGQRVNEIGIRMALGATRATILRLLVGGSMARVGLGIVVGLVVGVAFTQVLSGVLFDSRSTDPTGYCICAGFLLSIAFAASYVPAYRASGVDPMDALRSE